MYGYQVGTLIPTVLYYLLFWGTFLLSCPRLAWNSSVAWGVLNLRTSCFNSNHKYCGYRSAFPTFGHRSDPLGHKLKYVVWGDFHKHRAPSRHLDWDDTHLSAATDLGYHAHFYLVTERPPAENKYKIINRTLSTLRDHSFDIFMYLLISIQLLH